MKIPIFAVQDSKAGIFLQPFPMQNNAVAIRAFSHEVNKPGSNFSASPSDYTLYHLGEYDDQTGRFENVVVPENLGTANQYISLPGGK